MGVPESDSLTSALDQPDAGRFGTDPQQSQSLLSELAASEHRSANNGTLDAVIDGVAADDTDESVPNDNAAGNDSRFSTNKGTPDRNDA